MIVIMPVLLILQGIAVGLSSVSTILGQDSRHDSVDSNNHVRSYLLRFDARFQWLYLWQERRCYLIVGIQFGVFEEIMLAHFQTVCLAL